MDPRTAAHTLDQIAAFLELKGESPFKVKAYSQAARAVAALETDDLETLDRDGVLAATPRLGKATLSVVRDLIAGGESRYLNELRAEIPESLVELLDVAGLAAPKIRVLHEQLGVDSLATLESAARDGRLAKVKGFGPKTAEKILRGIERIKTAGTQVLYLRGLETSLAVVAAVRAHEHVLRAEVAGSTRRHRETIGDVDVVASCSGDPVSVANDFAEGPGVRIADGGRTAAPRIMYVDGTQLDLYCVPAPEFTVAWWRATGSAAHVAAVVARLAARGITLQGDSLRAPDGHRITVDDEATLYSLAGLPFILPELREEGREFVLAERGALPRLVEIADIRGTLHCHSTYSDGKATITEMAQAAAERGWSYIGITDHSQSAFYAGGMSSMQLLAQHAEIDALNASGIGIRILKGIEADILADGTLDYDAATLDRFDFVVGSVHSRFSMDRTTMTNRVLRALDDPHLTILGHPTGRLLLSRDPYPIDMDAVLEKCADRGVAVELNADPKRLDLDWRLIPRALDLGVSIEIGTDSHSTKSLDYMKIGVGMARKAGVEAGHVLNARSVDDMLAFARARRG
ncbi:MAG: DNA polymerase/3'-5' exonuclease PolX [Gemmatimonadota bacterium]